MSAPFLQVCQDVAKVTRYIQSFEQCRPHWQRVLDYIHSHPEERPSIVLALTRILTEEDGAAPGGLYLLQFLMESLRWPEVKHAAENFTHDGNGWYDAEVRHLLEVYDAA